MTQDRNNALMAEKTTVDHTFFQSDCPSVSRVVVSWGCTMLVVVCGFHFPCLKTVEEGKNDNMFNSQLMCWGKLLKFTLTEGLSICTRPRVPVLSPTCSRTPTNSNMGVVILRWNDNMLILVLYADHNNLVVALTKCSQSSWWLSLSRERRIFCSSKEMVVSPCCWLRSCTVPGLCVWPVSMAATESLSCSRPSACTFTRCNCVALNPESTGKATSAFLPVSTLLFFNAFMCKIQFCCCLSKFLNSLLYCQNDWEWCCLWTLFLFSNYS